MGRQHHQKLTSAQLIKSFISGGCAGMISKTIIAPIERIKILYLTRSLQFRYKSAFTDLLFIVKTHGVLNLWRGNLMNIIRVFPHSAIDFAVFDFLRKRFYINDGSASSKAILYMCGASAGCTAISITTPLQLLRVRMGMEKDRFNDLSYASTIRKILQKEGFRGFYRGYMATLMGIFVYHGTSFFVFTKIKQEIRIRYPAQYTNWYVDFLVGAISSMGQFIAYPFDMIRKRMQGQALLHERKEVDRILNYRQLIGKMSGEGIRSFYKGMTVNFIKAPLALAVSWTVKNSLNRYLDELYDL